MSCSTPSRVYRSLSLAHWLAEASHVEVISRLSHSDMKIDIPIAECGRVRLHLGDPRVFGTGAYWIARYREIGHLPAVAPCPLGRDLCEETVACLLGGFGFRASLGLMAFKRLRERGLTRPYDIRPVQEYLSALSEPFLEGERQARYRFPNQRAVRVRNALEFFRASGEPPAGALELRQWLTMVPGVGLKTASWVVRNRTASDDVAVLDIHVVRAGRAVGLFPQYASPQRNYHKMESAFVGFARYFGMRTAILDSIVWRDMRVWGRADLPSAERAVPSQRTS